MPRQSTPAKTAADQTPGQVAAPAGRAEQPRQGTPGPPSHRRPARRGRARGALAAVGGLLLASALLRSAIGASEALAKGEPDPGAAPAPVVAEPAAVVAEADILPLLAALDAREARLDRRAEEIAVRMQALTLAEEEIAQKLAALEEAEQALRATLALARTAAEDDLTRLTEVYANMKPKQAAALFEQMDPDFAAGFLSRMQPGAAAAIMAGMTPETAYLVSVIVAGRNAEVPRD